MDLFRPSGPVFYSSPESTDPSERTDEELMRHVNRLCSVKLWKHERGRLKDLSRRRPEQLPPCFVAEGKFSHSGWQSEHGRWVPRKVSSVGNMLGVKTTMVFQPKAEGIKVDIGKMELYNRLVPCTGGFFLDKSFSLCCVFPKGKGPAADPCNDFVPPPLHEWEELGTDFDGTKSERISVADYGVGGPKKRQRGGGGWEGYTKIYTDDPDLIYAACNHCTTMLKLKPNSGTGSQSHHNKSCMLKNLTTIMNSMDTP